LVSTNLYQAILFTNLKIKSSGTEKPELSKTDVAAYEEILRKV